MGLLETLGFNDSAAGVCRYLLLGSLCPARAGLPGLARTDDRARLPCRPYLRQSLRLAGVAALVSRPGDADAPSHRPRHFERWAHDSGPGRRVERARTYDVWLPAG